MRLTRNRALCVAAAGLQVSQTLVSTGTRAIFLAPVDALHGDIGIVQSGDLLVLLSKTGMPSCPSSSGRPPAQPRARTPTATDAMSCAVGRAGDSSELTELVPYARVKGARIIAITADASSACVSRPQRAAPLPPLGHVGSDRSCAPLRRRQAG